MVSSTPLSPAGSPTSRVTLVFPSGREYLWVSSESAVAAWQVDDIVVFRNSRWLVVGRHEEPDGLTVTLSPPA
jgi:hypothetical protein